MPQPPGFFAKMIPGTAGRFDKRVQEGELKFRQVQAHYEETQRRRAVAFAAFQEAEDKRKAEIEQENAAIHELKRGLTAAEHGAVLSFFQAAIDGSLRGEPDAISAELGYSPDSKHLV